MKVLQQLRKLLTRRGVRALLLLPLGIGLLYLAFRQVELEALASSLWQASYWPVIAAMGVGLLAHFLRALRWQIQLEDIGGRVSLFETFYAVMLGYTVNLVLPRAGELARCGQIAAAQQLPLDRTIGSMVGERLSDLIMSVLLLGVAIGASYDYFGAFVLQATQAKLSELDGAHLLKYALIGSVAIVALGIFIIRLVGRQMRDRLRAISTGLLAGIRTLWRSSHRMYYLLYTLLIWFCYWLMTYLVCLALPETAALPVMSSLLLLVAGTLGMIVPVQGGIGSFHMAVTLWLEVEGLSRAEGLAYATLSHGAQMLLVLLLALVLLCVRTVIRTRSQRKTMQETMV